MKNPYDWRIIQHRPIKEIATSFLCSGAGIVLLAIGTQATAATPGSVENGDKAEGSDKPVEEIIVTANRRNQRLQDVPIAISAISGQSAISAGITGTADIQQAVPALQISRNGSNATPFIRGIGSSNGTANAEGSVAIYIDGVYQPAGSANYFELNNIDRVEVLKGPQGTLFGRNATGGVIQIITKDPSQAPTVDVSLGYSNYQTVTTNAYVAGGITKNLSVGVSLLYENRNDGWGKQISTGDQTPGARDFAVNGKILFTPSDNTQIRVSANYSRSEDGLGLYQIVPGAMNVLGQGYPGQYNVTTGFLQHTEATSRGGAVKVNHDFGPVQIQSISAYQLVDSSFSVDQDSSVLPLVTGILNEHSRMISQELHLLSPTRAPFQWLIGGYYFNYNAGFVPASIFGLAFGPSPDDGIDISAGTKVRSEALFAQGTYPVTTTTNITAGFRYTWDGVSYDGAYYAHNTSIIVDPINGVPARAKVSYGKPTWRISVDQKLAPDIRGYVSYNRGIKSGGFSIGTSPTKADGLTPLDPYQPEQLDAFEVGVKSELFDRRLRLNLAGFYYDYKNIQFQKAESTIVVIVNGPSARSYGAEADLDARIYRNLTLTVGSSYLHTRIGNFPDAPNTQRDPVTGLTNSGVDNYNAEGNNLPFAPKFSISSGLTYDVPTPIGNFDANTHFYHVSSSFSEIDDRLRVASYNILNASVGWSDAQDHYSIRVWGKNLTKAYYYTQLTSVAGFNDFGTPCAPRTYGVTMRAKF